MSNNIIATIRLAPGHVGYYDEYSRIHLTLGSPRANVYSGTNCGGLRRSVKNGVILLESGSFGPDVPDFKIITDKNGQGWYVDNFAEQNKPVYAEDIAKHNEKEDKKEIEKMAEKEVEEATTSIVGEEIAPEPTEKEDIAIEEKVEEVVEEAEKEAEKEEAPKKRGRRSTKK